MARLLSTTSNYVSTDRYHRKLLNMFLHLLLLLPTIESSNIVINEYSIKQVKLDDEMINKVLVNLFPKNPVAVVKATNDTEDSDEVNQDKLGDSFIKPVFENEGQKRFKKVSNNHKVAEVHMSNKKKVDTKMKAAEDDSDPMLLLSRLVVKLMDYLPPKLKLPDEMQNKESQTVIKLDNQTMSKNGVQIVSKEDVHSISEENIQTGSLDDVQVVSETEIQIVSDEEKEVKNLSNDSVKAMSKELLHTIFKDDAKTESIGGEIRTQDVKTELKRGVKILTKDVKSRVVLV